MTSAQGLAKLCEMDPEFKQFLASHPKQPPIPHEIEAFRAMAQKREADELQRFGPVSSKVKEEWSYITMSDGYRSRCKVFRPRQPPPSPSSPLPPLVVLFHGGGFSVGSPDQLTGLGRAIAELLGAVCVCPCYRQAPEHAFPQAAYDAWETVQLLAEHAKSWFGADPLQGFIVGGSSSGANLASVAVGLAIQHGLAHPVTGQCLSAPFMMWDPVVPEEYRDRYCSLEQNANAPVLPRATMQAIFDRYAPDVHSPYFSPLNSSNSKSNSSGVNGDVGSAQNGDSGSHQPTAASSSLSMMPRTYLLAFGMDSVRDDALIYNSMLEKEGVETRLDVYAGLPHNSWGFVPGLQSSLSAVVGLLKNVAWLSGKEVDDDVARDYFGGWYGPGIHAKAKQRT